MAVPPSFSVAKSFGSFEPVEACCSYANIAGKSLYRLNLQKLVANQCYFYFLLTPTAEEHMLSTAMEFTYFHPSTPQSRAFGLSHIACEDFVVSEVRFPKEYLDCCRRIASSYSSAVVSKEVVIQSATTHIHFPQSDNVLFYRRGERVWSEAEIERECVRLEAIGNSQAL